ncbi:MAG: LacI family DNA-binding transcriptional regulator [Anaerolineae bacterium]|nr:LacI family transcriptional regulator [Candidatus Roseilinea sp.]MDW8451527.1 LacI family DNA-binding transcriptional regulator [Anaerolineae bacterium]
MVTIKDVADLAQVSATTVSHVINQTRYVDPATRQRVTEAIAELGYRPNTLARSLRRRETRTIGLIVPDNSNPYFAELARAVEDAGFAKGYSVILCNSDMSEAKEAAYIEALLSKRVDGIILISAANRRERFNAILQAGIPVVTVARELSDLPIDQVVTDNEQGGYLVGRYLIELGHRQIGCIAGPRDETPSADRIVGLRRALQEAGVHLPSELVIRGDFTYESGTRVMAELLSRCPHLTAVFAANDRMAIGAMNHLWRAGRRIPDDISIVGFDDIPVAATTCPPLTTVAPPKADFARVSVSLLIERITAGRTEPFRIVLPTRLVIRESCRAIA